MPQEPAPGARDAYRVLYLQPDAPQEVVAAAFRALAARYHPDVNAVADADARMAELNTAYAKIRTPEQRTAYDTTRTQASRAPAAWKMGVATPPPERSDDDGSPILDFGRYAGWTIADLARHDPAYLRWLSRHPSGFAYRREIERRLGTAPGRNKPSPRHRG